MEADSMEGSVGSQVPPGKPNYGANTGSFLTLTMVFLVMMQVYKKKKHLKVSPIFPDDCVGFEILPKLKNSLPFKFVGPILELWPFSRALETGVKWYEQMGDLFRAEAFNQSFVIFNSGPTLQALLKSTNFDHLHKSPLVYEALKPHVTNGLLVSDGQFWQKQRKILIKSQGYSNIRGYMAMLNKHVNQMVQSLETRFKDGGTHTINDILNVSFLEIIAEIITGERQDRSEELHHYHKKFTFWKDSIPFRVLTPFLLWEPLWRYTKYRATCKELSDFARRRIKEAKQRRAIAKHNDGEDDDVNRSKPAFRSILDELLDADVDETQMVDEINTMMFGGHETGASTVHCLLFALALNPHVQEQARREVDELCEDPFYVKNGKITHDATQGGLKYVERCILEALRLFPPVFVMSRKLLSPLKIEYEGSNIIIPAGVNCIISPWAIHRMEKNYPNPLKFDPDRFLSEETEKRHTYTYIPFSAGIRNCLGLKFAMIEMKTVISYILRNFELSTPDRMEDVRWMPYTTLSPKKDFNFNLKKRSITNL